MARYRVTKKSFIDGKIVQPGEIVEYDGEPGDNLEPQDADGEKAAAKRKAGAVDRARQGLAGQARAAGAAVSEEDEKVADKRAARAAAAAAKSGDEPIRQIVGRALEAARRPAADQPDPTPQRNPDEVGKATPELRGERGPAAKR